MKQKIIKGKKVNQLTMSDLELFGPELNHVSKKLMLRFFAWTNKYIRAKDGIDPMESIMQLKQFLQRAHNIKLN